SLVWTLVTLAGEVLARETQAVEIKPGKTHRAMTVDLAQVTAEFGPGNVILFADLMRRDEVISSTMATLVKPKGLDLQDPKLTVTRLIAEDDLVAFWATYSGIQDGPMGPFPATGKPLELDFAGMHRINDGKIVETWVIWDNLTGLMQLGFYPPEPVEVVE
ncbi:MAG: ester cyclase, partial [Acidobacteria bacterium]|nr:ester cyclase [Candidatus Sulfomarinibacter sp. MAG AM2]